MKMNDITLKTSDYLPIAKDLTINVRVSRPLRFRIWLAVRFVRAAGWLAGAQVKESCD